MVLWRISRHVDLSGVGGLKSPGRWHNRGQLVVYLSESPASALLEICVHTIEDDVPDDFILLRIEGPDIPVEDVHDADLQTGWVKKPRSTRAIGSKWLHSNAAVLLRVPSAIVPHTFNYLFNPVHPDAQSFSIVEVVSYPFDIRIKR
jgi:RES domain-containing protein